MMKLECVVAFVQTAEAGSISEASRRLGLAKSVVSERLAELERALGTRLIQRTTRKLSLTVNGETFLPRAQRILREVNEASTELSERSGTLSGPLRVSAPVGFGVLHLGPALCRFLAAHPAISLTLDLDDRFVNAAADGYDAVLRHGPLRDTHLVASRLATSRRFLVAAPAYLAARGAPRSLAELEGHGAILYSNRDTDWRFRAADEWTAVRPRPSLRVNNGLVMRDAAIAGLGIALLPSFFVHADLDRGVLVAIDIEAEAEGAELFIAYPRDHGASAKIRALTKSLRESFGNPPYWERGEKA